MTPFTRPDLTGAALERAIAKHRPKHPDPVLHPVLDEYGRNVAALAHWRRLGHQ